MQFIKERNGHESTIIVPRGAQPNYLFAFTTAGLPSGYHIYPAEATIQAVSVNPASADVTRGDTLTFSATVDGTGSFSKAVTWAAIGGGFGSGSQRIRRSNNCC